jgi:ParB family transcriptional regulator, chromosome partitioning protein
MEGQRLEEIPVKDVKPNPRQPRRKFDRESLEQMARSIEVFGVVQPIVVRTVGTDYELVAGERRWRAAQEAGLEKIPAVIRQTTETDSLEMALIENLHRSDLNGIEEATAYQQLLDDFAITHEELSKRLGKSRTTISNTIRLLQLPPHIQKEVIEGRITTGHARALLTLQDKPEEQDRMCARIIEEGLSVREAEGGTIPLEAEEKQQRVPREKRALPEEVVGILSSLAEILDARVKGSLGKRKGKLIIEFRDMKDLRRIYENIVGPWEAGEDSMAGQSGKGESSGPGLQPAIKSSDVETGSPAEMEKGAGDPFWTAPGPQGGRPG